MAEPALGSAVMACIHEHRIGVRIKQLCPDPAWNTQGQSGPPPKEPGLTPLAVRR